MTGILPFFIVCPLTLLGGFVDAIAGGGGFFTLTAYLLAGLPVHNAIATNKLSSSMGTTMAVLRYIRRGYVPWKLTLVCLPAALLGASVGAGLALRVSDLALRRFMLLILPVTAFYVLREKNLDGGKRADELPFGRTAALCLLIALAFGVYDGFYGPGTGTFLLLLFTGLAHLELRSSAGLAKMCNYATNLASLAVYLFSGNVLFLLGLAGGCFSLVGNYLGTRSFFRAGNRLARPMILLVLVVFFGKLFSELLF